MVFKTGFIQNTKYGGPQTTGFTWGLKRNYFILFRFRKDTFPCFSSQLLGLETVFSSEIFQSVTGIPDVEALALNTVDIIVKRGIPWRMCFSLSPEWFLSLANIHFSLKRRWHMLLCLGVDVCSSLDHGWDCWDVLFLSTLAFLSPSRCFFVSLAFHI